MSRLGGFFVVMDDKMGEIKYVQLEAGDFLADPDFQLMTDAERGIYISIIFYMYNNDGKIQDDSQRIKSLTNSGDNFEISWKTVRKKFIEKNGFLLHRRVRKELSKAKRFLQRQRKAGLASAAARQPRFNHGSTTVQPSLQPSKVKESKVKESKDKFKPPTLKEVIEYVKEKGYQVDVKKFFEYYTESDWHDRDGKPVRNWKQKIIAVWNKPGGQQKCRRPNCNNIGVYTSTDDTGQICWWCEKHKQGWKPALPKELTENTLKIAPKKDMRSLSDKQNEQKNKLGVR